MGDKPTYQALEERVRELEKRLARTQSNEKRLVEQEAGYRGVVENSSVGILVAQDLKIVFVNAAIAEVLGYSKEELLHQSDPFKFIHPDDREMVFQRHLDRINGQTAPETYEYRVITKSGKTIWVEVTGMLIQWRQRSATLNFFMEVTERRKTQKALREQHDTFESLLSISPVGIGLVERQRIKWVNESMRAMFRFDSESDYKEKDARLFYALENDYHRFGKSGYDQLRTKKIAVDDVVFQRKDGSTFIGHVKMRGIDPINPMEKAIFTISDITWRKRSEADKVKTEKLRGVLELAGAVCHELNQPLQSVCGYTELLTMDLDDDDPLLATASKIKLQADHMGEITRKLMNITHYETKKYLQGRIIDIDRAAGEGLNS